jgi:hypothetical protein
MERDGTAKPKTLRFDGKASMDGDATHSLAFVVTAYKTQAQTKQEQPLLLLRLVHNKRALEALREPSNVQGKNGRRKASWTSIDATLSSPWCRVNLDIWARYRRRRHRLPTIGAMVYFVRWFFSPNRGKQCVYRVLHFIPLFFLEATSPKGLYHAPLFQWTVFNEALVWYFFGSSPLHGRLQRLVFHPRKHRDGCFCLRVEALCAIVPANLDFTVMTSLTVIHLPKD